MATYLVYAEQKISPDEKINLLNDFKKAMANTEGVTLTSELPRFGVLAIEVTDDAALETLKHGFEGRLTVRPPKDGFKALEL